jgi:hypothetical protein
MFESWDKEICVAVSSFNGVKGLIEGKDLAFKGSPRELKTFDGTKSFLKRASRVYFGNETCARRLPERREIIEAYSLCLSSGKKMSLVLPYAGERDMPSIISAIEAFSAVNPGGEVIVNDFGIINLIGEKNIPVKMVLGRLISRQKRDPRFAIFPHTSNIAEEELSLSSFSVPSFSKFFLGLGVSRAGFSALPQGTDVSDVSGFEFDVYWPWVYVTSGRSCQLLGARDPKKGKYPLEGLCGKECLSFAMEPENEGDFYAIQKGNTVWMEVLKPGKLSGDFTRLIYEPVAPA